MARTTQVKDRSGRGRFDHQQEKSGEVKELLSRERGVGQEGLHQRKESVQCLIFSENKPRYASCGNESY